MPVLLGHDVENEEIDEAKSSLLLQPGTGRRPQALSAVKSRFFLMDGDAAGGAPARQGAEGNGAVVTARRGELVEGGPEDCEVVVFEERVRGSDGLMMFSVLFARRMRCLGPTVGWRAGRFNRIHSQKVYPKPLYPVRSGLGFIK